VKTVDAEAAACVSQDLSLKKIPDTVQVSALNCASIFLTHFSVIISVG
jgi:hypothetical protein